MGRKKKKKRRKPAQPPKKAQTPKAPKSPAKQAQASEAAQPEPVPPAMGLPIPKQQKLVFEFSELVYIKTLAIIAVVVVVLYVLYHLRSVLTPVFVALALAYLINPMVDRMQQWGVKRHIAIWSLVFALFAFFAFVGIVFVPKLIKSIEYLAVLAGKIPPLVIEWKLWLEKKFSMHFPSNFVEAVKTWGEDLKKYAPQAVKPAKDLLTIVFSGSMGLLSGFFSLLLIPLFTFYFLKGYENLRERFVDYIPLTIRDRLMGRLEEIDRIISGFIRGQVTVSIVVGLLYLVLLTFVGVPLAPAIAVGGALLNVVPYLGFLTTFAVALIASLIEFQLQWQFFVVFFGMGAIHMIDVLYITPTVVGEKVGLSEIVVIFAVLAGGQLFGLIGVLLAIPLAAVVKVALVELLEIYQSSEFYTGTPSD